MMRIFSVNACWHPSGVRAFFGKIPGVSLRSTPGYSLSCLRHERPFSPEIVFSLMRLSGFKASLSAVILLFTPLCMAPLRAADVGALVAKGDQATALFKTADAIAAFSQAEKQEPKNVIILTKLAKAWCERMADTTVTAEKKAYGEKGLAYAQAAYALDSQSARTNLSLAICYGRVAPFMETRTKIGYSKLVNKHVEAALDAEPSNDTALYVLGCWHLEMATLNGFVRGIAEIIYGKFPAASLQEAISLFNRAIAINPNRLGPYVELGRAKAALGKKSEARASFERALRMPVREKDDPDAKARARLGLAKL
jgi:tetratricopeptide (TPR) repeat protein